MDQQTILPPPSFDADPELEQPSTASASTSRKESSKTATSKERFTMEDYDRLLSWLEHVPNFELLHGRSGQTSVGRPSGNSTSGFSLLATLISKQSKGRLNLNARSMRERFQRHKRKYMATKTLSSKTGFGVTDEDRSNGIYTLASKLDNLCPCYQRMDNLYGKKPNVKPLREKAGRDDDTSEDSSEDDIDAIESSFVDNDGGDNDRDGDNSNIDGRVLEEPILNPPDVNVNDILDLDGFDDMADIDNADQDNMDDLEIVEVPPTADSMPGQQVHKPTSLKRRHSETESNTSRKSRATDTRKAPPKLVQGSTQSPRNGFASAFLESSVSKLEVLKEVEEKKLEQEKDSTARQLELDRKRMELEERKLEAEKEQAERKLEAEQRSEDRRIGLEEKRLQWEKERLEAETDIRYKVQMAILVQSAMSNGYKLEDIEKIMAMVTKK